MTPFDPSLWLCILCATVWVGFLHMVLDPDAPSWFEDARKRRTSGPLKRLPSRDEVLTFAMRLGEAVHATFLDMFAGGIDGGRWSMAYGHGDNQVAIAKAGGLAPLITAAITSTT